MMKKVIDTMSEHVKKIAEEIHGYHGATRVPDKKITMPVKIHEISNVHIDGIDAESTPDMILGQKIR